MVTAARQEQRQWDTRNLQKNTKEERSSYMEVVTSSAGGFEKDWEDAATVLNIEVYIDV